MNRNLAKPSTAPPYAFDAWLAPNDTLDGIAPIDHLFNRIDGLYPQKWRSVFHSDQAIKNWRDTWAEGLSEERVTPDEIRRGLLHCRRHLTWPPSFAEFMSACRPPIDPEAAFHEACEQMRRREHGKDAWSHPAIFWTAFGIGKFDLMNSTWPGIKSRWMARFKVEMDKHEWPDIPERRELLPEPGKCSISLQETQRRIQALKNKLVQA